MNFRSWQNWGIKWRIMLISLLPTVFLFLLMIFYLYHSRLIEVEQELEDRGRVMASSLAASSEYGVISGNIIELRQLLDGLRNIDTSIERIQVLDLRKNILVEVANPNFSTAAVKAFEATIYKNPIDVDMFSDRDELHATSKESSSPDNAAPTPLGYVKVVLSPSSMLAKKKEQILVGMMIATVALIVSLVIGLYFALGLTKPLSSTIQALRRIRSADYDIDLKPSAGGEIGELQATIVEISKDLKQFKEDLESKVAARTKDLEIARNQAIKAHAENRRLIQKVHSAVEEERENISVELHDHLNASLIVAKLSAKNIVNLTQKIPPTDYSEDIKKRAESIIDITADLYHLARSIVKRLRPEVIDTLGLEGAVEEMMRHYDELHPNCEFVFAAEGDFSALDSELKISAYRLIQEALSNIVKHAEAASAEVRLQVQEDRLVIKVTDNGKGFDYAAIEPGIGLIGLRERVHQWNGTLDISSNPGAGTTIVATMFFR